MTFDDAGVKADQEFDMQRDTAGRLEYAPKYDNAGNTGSSIFY